MIFGRCTKCHTEIYKTLKGNWKHIYERANKDCNIEFEEGSDIRVDYM